MARERRPKSAFDVLTPINAGWPIWPMPDYDVFSVDMEGYGRSARPRR